jgi:hypothetical protein
MSQYGITWRCGHETTVDITGTNAHGERERKAESLALLQCPACRRAGEKAGQQQAAAEAAAGNAAAGLSELTGSEKQVAWAETIRRDAIAAVLRSVRRSGSGDLAPDVEAIVTRAAAREVTARAWIDARHDPRAVIRDRMDDADRDAMAMLQAIAEAGAQ